MGARAGVSPGGAGRLPLPEERVRHRAIGAGDGTGWSSDGTFGQLSHQSDSVPLLCLLSVPRRATIPVSSPWGAAGAVENVHGYVHELERESAPLQPRESNLAGSREEVHSDAANVEDMMSVIAAER